MLTSLSVTQNPPMSHDPASGQFHRAACAEVIADALYRASHPARAGLHEAPPSEPLSSYRQAAEAMVAVFCDPGLDLAQDYYAISCIAAEDEADVETLSLDTRLKLLKHFRVGLNGWLRVARGMYRNLDRWKALAAADRAHVKALQEARMLRFRPKGEPS